MTNQGVAHDCAGAALAPLRLSASQRRRVARAARRGLARALWAQALAAVVVALVCAAFAGVAGAVSALVGAACYWVPNALFALRLQLGQGRVRHQVSLDFFWGEVLKLALSVALLAAVAWRFADLLVWPAFLLGLLGVMKGYMVLLATRRLP